MLGVKCRTLPPHTDDKRQTSAIEWISDGTNDEFGPLLDAANAAAVLIARHNQALLAAKDLPASIVLTEGQSGAIYNATGPRAIPAERAALVSEILGTEVGLAVISVTLSRAA